MDRLLKEPEVLDALSLSRVTLWRMREANELPYIRIRGAVRYRESDVARFIEQRSTKGRKRR